MARRQIEYEKHQLLGAMADKLGSNEQSTQRQEARLQRIRSIESEMIQLQCQQHAQQQRVRYSNIYICQRRVRCSYIQVHNYHKHFHTVRDILTVKFIFTSKSM